MLEQNYRSTQTILNAANAVITHGRASEKRLWSDAGDGERIVGWVADTEHDEAQYVADEIDRLTDDGIAKPGDVAVFYRTSAIRAFEEVFIRVGMPYRVVGGVRFYERKEIRDAIAYLRSIANPADDVSVRRILNTPRRGIGERAEAAIEALAAAERIPFGAALARASEATGLATRSLTQIQSFATMLGEHRAMMDAGDAADTILTSILERSGYIDELKNSDDPQDATRLENLIELVSVAQEFDLGRAHHRPAPGRQRAGFRGSRTGRFAAGVLGPDRAGRRLEQIPDADGEGAGVVTLMTLHTAKGLEFPVVFLTGLGRHLPASAHAREQGRAGGGAPAGVCGNHPGTTAALSDPRGGAHHVGFAAVQPAEPVHRRDPAAPFRLATAGHGAGRLRVAGQSPHRAGLAQHGQLRLETVAAEADSGLGAG